MDGLSTREAARARAPIAAALLLVLLALYTWSERLPNLGKLGDVLWTGVVLTSLLFGLTYALIIFSDAPTRRLLVAVLGLVSVAALLHAVGLGLYATFPKLIAASLLGFWFLRFFEKLSWVVIVALLIPFVDTLSVWRGPTNKIIHEAPQAFDLASIAFPMPGERVIELRWAPPVGRPGATYDIAVLSPTLRSLTRGKPYCSLEEDICDEDVVFPVGANAHRAYTFSVSTAGVGSRDARRLRVPESAGESGAAEAPGPARGGVRDLRASSKAAANQLGLTDVFFFALFLGAAARFGLRTRATWVGLVGGIAATTALVSYGATFAGGLPALPLISVGFLLPNVDLLWAALKRGPEQSSEST